MFDKIFQKNSKRIPKNFKRIPKEFHKNSKIWFIEWLEKHLRYLSDFFSAIVKCIWKKIFEKSVDLITPVLIKNSLHTKRKTAKNLYSAFDPLNCLCTKLIWHFFFSFHIFIFSHSKSIDYIMIILELISPQTAHYWAKILAYYTKKITIIKKKRRPNIVTALLPARDQLQKQQKKSQFLVNWPDKKHKKNTKIWPTPHLYNWLAKRIVSVYGF